MRETQTETLERFFRALTDAMREARPDEARPLTVAEIYQSLVPYRVARSRVGFAMNADYEHALMRLLAGEGEYLRLDPEEARRELQRELSSTNPDVTLYRKFAACDVVLATPLGNGHAPADAAPHAAAAAFPQTGEGTPGVSAPRTSPPETPARRPDAAAGERHPAEPVPADCHACGEALPTGRTVRFCPYCGRARRVACAECGELLEAEWRFCTVCGRRAGSGT